MYRAAIEYVGWAYHYCEALKGHRHAKDQLLRASQAIPLNIAEGNGKATDGDRRRYFEIARGSALECGAVQDVLHVCGALSAEESESHKALLDRIVAMLTKLGRRGYAVHEECAEYVERIDPDSDSDPDTDGNPDAGHANKFQHRTPSSLRSASRLTLASKNRTLGVGVGIGIGIERRKHGIWARET